MEDFNGRSNHELVAELLTAFNSFKQKLEDPNYMQMEIAIKQMMEGQREMRQDISDLKRQLLNPYDGVIVETKKNTEFREDSEEQKLANADLVEEHKSLMRWKSTMTKVGVAILTSSGAIIAFVISNFFMRGQG
tara:strand:- start:1429 stop:1830 length:402 start_codon:yes stop_codon:yes gene_type:complete